MKRGYKTFTPEEYAERVVLILSMLRPDIVVQRIVGRASANTLSVNGGRPWWEVKRIYREADEKQTYSTGIGL